MPTKAEEAALAAARKSLLEDGVEAEDTPSGEETDESTVTSHDAEETVDDDDPFAVEIPEDLLAELEEPEERDFLGEAESEVEQEYDEYSQLSDNERELLKRARAAEKKAAYYESIRLQKDKKDWKAEAAKFFPLSEPFLDEPHFQSASSRRALLRQAKSVHEKLKPKVDAALAKERERLAAQRETAKVEAKTEAKKAWGEATVEVAAVPSESEATLSRVEKARARRDLTGALKAMMFEQKE